MNVREAVPADAAAAAALLSDLGYPDNAPGAVRERLERVLADPANRVLVAEEEDGPVGLAYLHIVALLERDGVWGRLAAFVVAERARGRGVGRMLMGAVEAVARESGCELVELSTNVRRGGAHAFYRATGYEPPTDRLRFMKSL